MKKLSGDWKFLLIFSSIVLTLIVITGVLAPNREDRDPTPTTWNSGTAGAKAAYLLLTQLGYNTVRWEQPETELSTIDPAHATLILAEPSPSFAAFTDKKRQQPFIDFLHRGGRIVATGAVVALFFPMQKSRSPIAFSRTSASPAPQVLMPSRARVNWKWLRRFAGPTTTPPSASRKPADREPSLSPIRKARAK